MRWKWLRQRLSPQNNRKTRRVLAAGFGNKKDGLRRPKNKIKKRSDPRSQFWYAAIGGHFWWFLVSNIFCDPLFLLSICLPYFFHRFKHKSIHFSMENTVGLGCYFSGKETRLVLCDIGGDWLSIHFDALVFRTERIVCFIYQLNSVSHIGSSLANQWSALRYTAVFVDILIYLGIDGSSDMPPCLTKWVDSSVHWTAPPSPKFPEEFYRCCSLG